MVASSDPHWLQGSFNTLVGLFDRVGLQTNFGKTVGMVYRPCQADGTMLEAAYGRRIMGEGPRYRERLKGRVSCRDCGEMMAEGSLASQLMTQHGRVAETRRSWRTLAAGAGPRTFRMSFPAKGGPRSCPVEGRPDRVVTRKAMRVHFLHWHVLKTVVILEDGTPLHPRCAQCDMMVPRRALKGRHPATAQCARGAEPKRRQLAEAKTRESSERAFEAYEEPLKNVTKFRYLGQVLTEGDNDWLAVVGNLGKAQKSWGRLSWILSREGADPKVSGSFYKAMTQAVLLFGAETWVLAPSMERALDRFQHRVARWITRKKPRRWELGVPASSRGNGGSDI